MNQLPNKRQFGIALVTIYLAGGLLKAAAMAGLNAAMGIDLLAGSPLLFAFVAIDPRAGPTLVYLLVAVGVGVAWKYQQQEPTA